MSPLSKKGARVLASMEKTYKDPKKARSVMYASIRAGRLSGVDPTFEKNMTRRKRKT